MQGNDGGQWQGSQWRDWSQNWWAIGQGSQWRDWSQNWWAIGQGSQWRDWSQDWWDAGQRADFVSAGGWPPAAADIEPDGTDKHGTVKDGTFQWRT